MSLGERICMLRNAKGFSQSDLAERLEVSRQSVSKWETNASVPDLDKLIKLSTLFEVSLDELVMEKETEEEKEMFGEGEKTKEKGADAEIPAFGVRPEGRKLAALILLCTGLLIGLLMTALTRSLWGMILGIPFLLCALVCMIARKHPGLWCTWLVLGILDMYFALATGITWPLIFWTFRYTAEMNDMRLLVAWVMLVGRLILMTVTAWHLRSSGKRFQRKTMFFLFALFAFLHLPIQVSSTLLYQGLDWGKVICGAGLLTGFFRMRTQTQMEKAI